MFPAIPRKSFFILTPPCSQNIFLHKPAVPRGSFWLPYAFTHSKLFSIFSVTHILIPFPISDYAGRKIFTMIVMTISFIPAHPLRRFFPIPAKPF